MNKIAIYSRKSKLSEQGESIKNQVNKCISYANIHFKNPDFIIYEDEGYSGKNIDRPKFQQLLKDAQNKKFDVLMCYKLDRVSRNTSNFSSILEVLNNLNISFVSVSENFDTSTPMGRAMIYISSVFSQLERETLAERVRDNMMYLSRSGRWLGGQTPTGFKSECILSYDEHMQKRKMYKLCPIENEICTVKTIYNKYLELKSLSKLESFTFENNIKSKNNKNFDKSSLKIILTNPVYAVSDHILYDYFKSHNCDIASPKCNFDNIHAPMVFNKHEENKKSANNKKIIVKKNMNKWIVAIASHEGIIASKDWIKVQNLIHENSKNSRRTSQIGLLSPLLKCSNCGSHMRVSSYKKGSKTYYYYRCTLKENSKSTLCSISNLSGIYADSIVLNQISNTTTSIKNKSLNAQRQYLKSVVNTILWDGREINIIKKE